MPTSSNGHLLITPLTPAADGMPPPICRPPFACPPSNPTPLPVPGAHLQALNEIAKRPFDAAELFSLHQYYFSPPAVGTQPTRLMKQQPPLCHVADPNNAAAAVLIMGTRQPVLRPVDSEEHLPPCKRQCNNLTTTPITYYPRLKVNPVPFISSRLLYIQQGQPVQCSALLPFSPLPWLPPFQARLESLLKAGSSSHEALSLLRQLRYLESLAQSTSGILTSGADVETTLLDQL